MNLTNLNFETIIQSYSIMVGISTLLTFIFLTILIFKQQKLFSFKNFFVVLFIYLSLLLIPFVLNSNFTISKPPTNPIPETQNNNQPKQERDYDKEALEHMNKLEIFMNQKHEILTKLIIQRDAIRENRFKLYSIKNKIEDSDLKRDVKEFLQKVQNKLDELNRKINDLEMIERNQNSQDPFERALAVQQHIQNTRTTYENKKIELKNTIAVNEVIKTYAEIRQKNNKEDLQHQTEMKKLFQDFRATNKTTLESINRELEQLNIEISCAISDKMIKTLTTLRNRTNTSITSTDNKNQISENKNNTSITFTTNEKQILDKLITTKTCTLSQSEETTLRNLINTLPEKLTADERNTINFILSSLAKNREDIANLKDNLQKTFDYEAQYRNEQTNKHKQALDTAEQTNFEIDAIEQIFKTYKQEIEKIGYEKLKYVKESDKNDLSTKAEGLLGAVCDFGRATLNCFSFIINPVSTTFNVLSSINEDPTSLKYKEAEKEALKAKQKANNALRQIIFNKGVHNGSLLVQPYSLHELVEAEFKELPNFDLEKLIITTISTSKIFNETKKSTFLALIQKTKDLTLEEEAEKAEIRKIVLEKLVNHDKIKAKIDAILKDKEDVRINLENPNLNYIIKHFLISNTYISDGRAEVEFFKTERVNSETIEKLTQKQNESVVNEKNLRKQNQAKIDNALNTIKTSNQDLATKLKKEVDELAKKDTNYQEYINEYNKTDDLEKIDKNLANSIETTEGEIRNAQKLIPMTDDTLTIIDKMIDAYNPSTTTIESFNTNFELKLKELQPSSNPI